MRGFLSPLLRLRGLALVVAVGLLVLLAGARATAEPPPPPPFVVIVHPSNAVHTLDRTFVSDAFLKKATRWPSGEVIKPVDLPPESAVREKFSYDILKRSVSAVKSYWQQIIFSGRDVPPVEVANDDEVVKYVQGHTGAIGYVSGGAHLGDAKVITVR